MNKSRKISQTISFCVKMILVLGKWQSLKTLENHLSVTERSIFRYMIALKEMGFTLEVRTVKARKEYRITGKPEALKNQISELNEFLNPGC